MWMVYLIFLKWEFEDVSFVTHSDQVTFNLESEARNFANAVKRQQGRGVDILVSQKSIRRVVPV